MHTRGNSMPGLKQLTKTALNLVSLLFKSVSLVNLKLKSRNRIAYPGAYIISIDNLSFGGTGKTPLILAIGKFLESRDIKFAIVTRGYKSKLEAQSTKINKDHTVEDTGDEAQLFMRYFPLRDIYVGRNRHDSIKQAIGDNNKIILMDDGFQSTDIKKNLSLMLVNPAQPYYYLRNFKQLAKTEDIFLFYSPQDNRPYEPPPRGWRKVSAQAMVGNYGFQLDHFCLPNGEIIDISQSRLAGFSALGDNQRFKQDLQAYNLVDFRSYPDHFSFDARELEKLNLWRTQVKADYLVCTEKDFVKCKSHNLSEIPLIYAKNSINFTFDLMNTILNHANESHNI